MASHGIVIVRAPDPILTLNSPMFHVDLDVTLRNLIYNGIELVVNGCPSTRQHRLSGYIRLWTDFDTTGDDYSFIDKFLLHRRNVSLSTEEEANSAMMGNVFTS